LILSAFAAIGTEATERYIRFVADGKGQMSPWEQLNNQVFLGSEAFIDAMRRKVPPDRDLREVPAARARPVAKAISVLCDRIRWSVSVIVAACASGGHTMKHIGDYFGRYHAGVRKISEMPSWQEERALFANAANAPGDAAPP
jgi:putative transposase